MTSCRKDIWCLISNIIIWSQKCVCLLPVHRHPNCDYAIYSERVSSIHRISIHKPQIKKTMIFSQSNIRKRSILQTCNDLSSSWQAFSLSLAICSSSVSLALNACVSGTEFCPCLRDVRIFFTSSATLPISDCDVSGAKTHIVYSIENT